MNNTPIDEYYFWKNLIEDKQEKSQPVPKKMFELLALAEIKMTDYLTKKHCQLNDSSASTAPH